MLTHDEPLTAAQIIKSLGGPTALSRRPELDVQRSAIANWPREGIPAKYWPSLARLAAETEATRHITIEKLEHHVRAMGSSQVAA